jgi:divalent metal cation (Fe/Co/Zn/Cd) transporter
VIFFLVYQAARAVMLRALDGVEPETLDEITHAARHVAGVQEVTDVRSRWIGHRLSAEVAVTVSGTLSVREGHDIAREVRHQLLHHLQHLGSVIVHIDPEGHGGEQHHRIPDHTHDGLPMHRHE